MAEERQEFCGEVTLWTRHDHFWIRPCMLLMVISACCYCSDLVFPFEMFLLGPGSCWWKELVLKLLSGIWEWQIGCKFYFISCCQVIDVRLKCDHDSVIWLFFQSSLFISQNFVLISMQIGARVSLDTRQSYCLTDLVLQKLWTQFTCFMPGLSFTYWKFSIQFR